MPDPGATLTRNWLHFGRILRGLGFDAGPARMLPFLTSLTAIDMRRSDDLRTVVHAHFARRREELALLDQALLAFLDASREERALFPRAPAQGARRGGRARGRGGPGGGELLAGGAPSAQGFRQPDRGRDGGGPAADSIDAVASR